MAMKQAADFSCTDCFEFIKTESGKTTGWVTYRLHSVITKDGKKTSMEWLETVFLEKQRKQWKVKHLHSTRLNRV